MGKNISLADRCKQELQTLEELGQRRRLDRHEGVNLCSNDYLGLATDPRLKRAVQEGLEHASAVGSTGSRLLSGNAMEWEQAETDFAQFTGHEAALYFSSGYMANVGLLSALLQSQDIVFSDALNHASIIDGIRLSGAGKVVYPHGDLEFLENALEKCRARPGARVIVTESVFSMDGDLADLSGLVKIARKHGAELVLDEAHATGVFGPEGRGLAAESGIEKEFLAIVHTCGKALGSMGAFVCSGQTVREYLVNRARTFLFSTAAPPYIALQIRAAVHLAQQADPQRRRLLALAEWTRNQLRAAGLNVGHSGSQIIPVILGTNEAALAVASHLQSHGFSVRAIRPPTVPAGTARLRISLTSKITQEQAERLVELLVQAAGQVPDTGVFCSHV